MNSWNFVPWTVQYLLAALFVLVIGMYVWFNSKKSKSLKYFFVYGISLVIWQLSTFLHRNAPNPHISKIFLSIVFSSGLLVAGLIVSIMLSIPKNMRYEYMSLIPILPISINLLLKKPFDLIWVPSFGWSYSIHTVSYYLIYFTLFCYIIFVILLSIYLLKNQPQLKKKIMLILFSWVGISATGIIVSNILIELNPNTPPFAGFLNIFSFIVIAYAIYLPQGKIVISSASETTKKDLISSYLQFLNSLRECIPGKEFGENVFRFKEILTAMGLEDVVVREDNKMVLNQSKLNYKEIKNIPDTILRVLKQTSEVRGCVGDFNSIFMKTYDYINKRSEEEAQLWLKDMLNKHGLFLKKYGITDLINDEIKMPDIIDEFELGRCYLIEEKWVEKIYDKFEKALANGFEGMIVTKLNTDRIEDDYRLEGAKIYRIVHEDSDNSISPDDLNRLYESICEVCEGPRRKIVAIDCVDQLMYANGLEKTLGFLNKIKKSCEKNDGIVLISINPDLFEKKQFRKIKSIFEEYRE